MKRLVLLVLLAASCAARSAGPGPAPVVIEPRVAVGSALEDVREVMHEPTSSLVTDCEGEPCLVLLYRNQLSASWVLLLYFNADGALTRATKVHLGPDAEPEEQFDATEEFRTYLRKRKAQKTEGGINL